MTSGYVCEFLHLFRTRSDLSWSLVLKIPQAPDAHRVNGKYHVYYSVSTLGSQNSAIGLATSYTMDPGDWTDHGSTGIESTPEDSYNAIDSNLINDGGFYYMNFGSFWHDIYQAPMSFGARKVVGTPNNIAYDPAGQHKVEGSYMYRFDDYYYLFYSKGQCCGFDTSRPPPGQEYMILVCRSSKVDGGFVRFLLLDYWCMTTADMFAG